MPKTLKVGMPITVDTFHFVPKPGGYNIDAISEQFYSRSEVL